LNRLFSAAAQKGEAPARAPVSGLARARQVVLAIVLVALVGTGVWLGHTGHLTQAAVGGWVRSHGAWSAPAFVGAFVVGELLHLPGMIFIAVARAAFGAVNGFFLGYGASILAVTAPFLLVRGMRTTRERAWQPRWRLLRRLLEGVEKHPVRSVAVLRLILWLSPPLDYALAFTSIRTRDYVLGSALGLAPCIGAVIWGLGWWWS
jgi:uncharacterized membrane protein YdjX (TVP38/TMEM64 family)